MSVRSLPACSLSGKRELRRSTQALGCLGKKWLPSSHSPAARISHMALPDWEWPGGVWVGEKHWYLAVNVSDTLGVRSPPDRGRTYGSQQLFDLSTAPQVLAAKSGVNICLPNSRPWELWGCSYDTHVPESMQHSEGGRTANSASSLLPPSSPPGGLSYPFPLLVFSSIAGLCVWGITSLVRPQRLYSPRVQHCSLHGG